ncbi:hypothetical protein TREMEDRAFT_60268 [Tremella mesenterica DSM 1558]|uniref:uncharacterized protein n=1 Tax=Tremella mesenterica (strain ATCC 24925 / CBS 8224 / DSM 1558 / NBRC 9311 / NRRL Y-6157 / RJB 2259-6 / UBC 559-6) TaxID=578456 RepID=UPI0003F4A482|nr:uncharacterized protein TREMEDRAFT_60268 [Tremella mesenterica DSM 1558]EIW71338.1 hypothetical protein TREMEDRAFT_60268 [Tremella mesenterica DSM 1558]
MASIITLPITLSPVPGGWSKPTPPSTPKLTPAVPRVVYPAGPSFVASARRQLLQRSFAEDDEHVLKVRAEAEKLAKAGEGEDEYPGLGLEEESQELLASDPKEWKKQDHYAILGLGHLRYKATDEHIKVAHRRKVLRHHPDKKAGASGSSTNDDAFFKCIQKAHETLTNPERRRQFDSREITVPSSDPWFAREARFSKIQPVPEFGGQDASKKEVEGFYDFWYNFDSWRSFEWHDKEVNEGSDSRDDKRFTEKKNKTERARRKKDDNTRLRELVDEVLAHDPRIKRIKAEEKAARDAKKKGGAGTTNGKPLTAAEKAAAAKKIKEEEEAKKEKEKKSSEASKADREAAKKAKEAARKNLKKWKKSIAGVITSSNYFLPDGTAPPASTVEKQLGELDMLCELLEPEEVKGLKEEVEKAGKDGAKDVLVNSVKALGDKGEGKFTEFA